MPFPAVHADGYTSNSHLDGGVLRLMDEKGAVPYATPNVRLALCEVSRLVVAQDP